MADSDIVFSEPQSHRPMLHILKPLAVAPAIDSEVLLVDFNGVLISGDKDAGFRDAVNKTVIFDLLLEKSKNPSNPAGAYIVEKAKEIYGSDTLESVEELGPLLDTCDKKRQSLISTIGLDFRKRGGFRHRIAVLQEYGCTVDEIHSRYNDFDLPYGEMYEAAKLNPLVIRTMAEHIAAKKEVVIWTDNSHKIASHGLEILKFKDVLGEELKSIGYGGDVPAVPMVSMFKGMPTECNPMGGGPRITLKGEAGSVEDLRKELKYQGIDLVGSTMAMLDDHDWILDELVKQGVVTFIVENKSPGNISPYVSKTEEVRAPEAKRPLYTKTLGEVGGRSPR